ncbi:PepSY domain-containing protein [Thioalkalivibrio sp.]|uniref:PepSY domain-containing protein n=1 Tax=Thioalkalivibrio sp. TaxID=2093813 RepID=UPI00356A1AF8
MRPTPDLQPGHRVRRMTWPRTGPVLVLAMFLFVALPAQGQFNTDDPEAAVWDLDEAVAQIEAHYPGRVLHAREDVSRYGARLFVIRILTNDQQVRTLRIEEGTEVELPE